MRHSFACATECYYVVFANFTCNTADFAKACLIPHSGLQLLTFLSTQVIKSSHFVAVFAKNHSQLLLWSTFSSSTSASCPSIASSMRFPTSDSRSSAWVVQFCFSLIYGFPYQLCTTLLKLFWDFSLPCLLMWKSSFTDLTFIWAHLLLCLHWILRSHLVSYALLLGFWGSSCTPLALSCIRFCLAELDFKIALPDATQLHPTHPQLLRLKVLPFFSVG